MKKLPFLKIIKLALVGLKTSVGGQGGNNLGLDHHMGEEKGEGSLPGRPHLNTSVRAGPGSG